MRTDLRSLEILLAVAEHGSLGAAARSLQISQPSVSAGIQRLERHLALNLVQRSPRGSRLTTAGATVADWGRDVLDASDRLETGAAALRERRAGRLRVSASMTIAEYLVPGWLTELRAASPGVSVALRVRNSEEVASAVLEGDADLGFVEGVRLPPGLHQRVLGVDRLVLVVAPAHPWSRRRRPIGATELAQSSLVLRESGSGTREAFERALAQQGHAVAPVVELGSTAAIKSALTAGDSAAVRSDLAVADEVARGRLRVVPVDGLDLRRRLRAVWRGDVRLEGPAGDLARCALRSLSRT